MIRRVSGFVEISDKLRRHPISRFDDLFASIQEGKKFIKLDMSQAY